MTKNEPNSASYRNWLAIGITGISILAIIILGALTIQADDTQAQSVLNSVLPLVGSWVGTILAYYFSKENFEAATRSVSQLAQQLTPQEKLQSTPLKEKMIPRSAFHLETITPERPPGQIKLAEMLDRLEAAKKGQRIPVLDKDSRPLYVVHRSVIDQFLAKQALGTPAGDPKALTLADLLNDPGLSDTLETSFAAVREAASLAEAKDAMDRTPNCQDVFATAGGTRYEPVTGWITNNILEDNAKV